MSLAAQKFLASILDEAVNIHKRKKLAPAQHLKVGRRSHVQVALISLFFEEWLTEAGLRCNMP